MAEGSVSMFRQCNYHLYHWILRGNYCRNSLVHRTLPWEESSKANNWWKNHLVYYTYTWAALLNTDSSLFKFHRVPPEDENKVISEQLHLPDSPPPAGLVLRFSSVFPRNSQGVGHGTKQHRLYHFSYFSGSIDVCTLMKEEQLFFFFPGIQSVSLLPQKLSELLALSHPAPSAHLGAFPCTWPSCKHFCSLSGLRGHSLEKLMH